MTATLRERADAAQLVREWVEEYAREHDGEIPDWLEELQEQAHLDLEEKARRTGHAILRLQGEVAAISAEMLRLQARQRARANAMDRLKEYATVCLQNAGVRKAQDALITVALQANGGKQRITYDGAAADIPEGFRKVRDPEPDTEAAREYYELSGQMPPGFTLHPRGESLRVR